jgi:hypothetical protein
MLETERVHPILQSWYFTGNVEVPNSKSIRWSNSSMADFFYQSLPSVTTGRKKTEKRIANNEEPDKELFVVKF